MSVEIGSVGSGASVSFLSLPGAVLGRALATDWQGLESATLGHRNIPVPKGYSLLEKP